MNIEKGEKEELAPQLQPQNTYRYRSNKNISSYCKNTKDYQ